ncbi:MAG: hypothetical protein QNJ44_18085 [Rhodobacter sp.]|nr:hypothetical protein [Rhodobacter sp.]
MADDCLVGFKFLENDDLVNDATVREAAESMFNEIVFDAASGHLGGKVEDAVNTKDTSDFGRLNDFENFDFTEGFDFVF